MTFIYEKYQNRNEVVCSCWSMLFVIFCLSIKLLRDISTRITSKKDSGKTGIIMVWYLIKNRTHLREGSLILVHKELGVEKGEIGS